jgi:hypothetical protein
MHAAHVDILNQPVLKRTEVELDTATTADGFASLPSKLRPEFDELNYCAFSQDSKVEIAKIIACNAIKGIDGICVVLQGNKCKCYIYYVSNIL